jgi:K+-sensing histidine kinase KdpD
MVLGGRLALRRVVANLLDNASTYGHVIQVEIAGTEWTIILTIDDGGPGISPDRREILLKPFRPAGELTKSADRRPVLALSWSAIWSWRRAVRSRSPTLLWAGRA